MDSKAKLKYDGLSYYDEDLEKIAKMFCKENKVKYQRYSIDRILESVLVWYGRKNEETMFKIPFQSLKNYRIPLTNEKPIINWPSTFGHFIYYRKDIWELAELVTKWNGFTFKEYKIDNRGKFLYIYFNHPVGKDAFLAMGFQDIENVRYYLHKKDQKGLMLKGRAWGNNLELQ
jgi:hypothetical protein